MAICKLKMGQYDAVSQSQHKSRLMRGGFTEQSSENKENHFAGRGRIWWNSLYDEPIRNFSYPNVPSGGRFGTMDGYFGPQLLFRMKDGSIRTKNQITDLHSWSFAQENEAVLLDGRFCEPVDPEEFQRVILNGMEYGLINPERSAAVEVDPELPPFTYKPDTRNDQVTASMPEFCKALGEEYSWDASQQKAVICYHEDVVELTAGSSVIVKNGNKIEEQEDGAGWIWNVIP